MKGCASTIVSCCNCLDMVIGENTEGWLRRSIGTCVVKRLYVENDFDYVVRGSMLDEGIDKIVI